LSTIDRLRTETIFLFAAAIAELDQDEKLTLTMTLFSMYCSRYDIDNEHARKILECALKNRVTKDSARKIVG